jgi:hypothetical protein
LLLLLLHWPQLQLHVAVWKNISANSCGYQRLAAPCFLHVASDCDANGLLLLLLLCVVQC